MNIKPTVQNVILAVGETQDGKKINVGDHYGSFLLSLINDNTEQNTNAIDAGEVDTESLETDLKYAISEFTKALEAVTKFNQ